MRAIILAAGKGKRMKKMTQHTHKSKILFRGKPLIEWQLEAIKKNKISKIAIITGYLQDCFNYNVNYFHNEKWNQTNMVTSLCKASQWLLEEDCIISYSDIVYSIEDLAILKSSPYEISILHDPRWYRLWSLRFEDPLIDAETFKFKNDIVYEIGNKTTNLNDIQGQFMGLIKLTPTGWRNVLNIMSKLHQGQIEKMDFTSLLQYAIKHSILVHTCKCKNQWFEFDTQHDLKVYEKKTKDNIFEHI